MKTKFMISYSLRSRTLSILAAAAALWAVPGSTRAASIGVGFGSGAGTLAATDSAGVTGFAQTNYNLVTAAPTGLLLGDNSGALTTAALTTTGATSFSAITATVAGPDEILNSNRANSGATTWSFSVASIPYASYSIIVYDLQFTTGAELGIGIGTTTFYTSSPAYNAAGYLDGNAATPYIYTPGVSTLSTAPTPLSDYVIFTGLSGAAQTVTLTGINGGGERIGGFQIVQTVPEPATWALLLVGGLGVLVGGRSLRQHDVAPAASR